MKNTGKSISDFGKKNGRVPMKWREAFREEVEYIRSLKNGKDVLDYKAMREEEAFLEEL